MIQIKRRYLKATVSGIGVRHEKGVIEADIERRRERGRVLNGAPFPAIGNELPKGNPPFSPVYM